MSELKAKPQGLGQIIPSAGATLISRILGFIRDIFIAHVLGPGADVFFAAFRIPNIARRFTAEGSLGLSYAVALGQFQAREERNKEKSGQASFYFTLQILAVFFLLSTAFALSLALFAKASLWIIAPGFINKAEEAANFSLYLRLCLPYIPFAALSAILSTSLVSCGRAGFAFFAPVLLNIGIIAAGILSFVYGKIAGVHSFTSLEPGIFFACGVAFGGFLQCLWLFWGFKKLNAGFFKNSNPVKPSTPLGKKLGKGLKKLPKRLKIPETIKNTLIKMPAATLASSAQQIHFFIAMLLASFCAKGSITALYLAERIIEFPLGLTGTVLATLAMPTYAKLSAENKSLKDNLNKTLSMSLFLSLPACAGLVVLAEPIARLLFGHGAFSLENTLYTAKLMTATAPALPAMALARPISNALMALDAQSQPLAKNKGKNKKKTGRAGITELRSAFISASLAVWLFLPQDCLWPTL